jgi:hydrogenase-4 component F
MDSLFMQFLVIPIILVFACLVIPRVMPIGNIIILGLAAQFILIASKFVPFLFSNISCLEVAPELQIDKLAASFLLLTAFVVASALSHAHIYFSAELRGPKPPQIWHIKLFYIFSVLFFVAMMAVYVCDNLGFLWISIEATTLLSAGLVYFGRDKHAIEATWKYLIVCSVGIAFALLGTVLIFASSEYGAVAAGSLNISELIAIAPKLQPTLLKLGFIFSLIGYGTKAGMFPLHSWLPDAHSEAPAPASAILSGALLNCALFAIWRILQIDSGLSGKHFCSEVTFWAGTVTVVAASLFLVRQHGLKRLWAYSSVENVGLMLVGIGLGSGTLFLLQAINHSIAKVALFLLSGSVIQLTGTKELHQMRGILKTSPLLGALLALAALAVAGVPPFGSFISEWLLIVYSAEPHHWIGAILLILALSLAFIAICSHVGRILLGSPRHYLQHNNSYLPNIIPGTLVVISFILGLITNPGFLRMGL